MAEVTNDLVRNYLLSLAEMEESRLTRPSLYPVDRSSGRFPGLVACLVEPETHFSLGDPREDLGRFFESYRSHIDRVGHIAERTPLPAEMGIRWYRLQEFFFAAEERGLQWDRLSPDALWSQVMRRVGALVHFGDFERAAARADLVNDLLFKSGLGTFYSSNDVQELASGARGLVSVRAPTATDRYVGLWAAGEDALGNAGFGRIRPPLIWELYQGRVREFRHSGLSGTAAARVNELFGECRTTLDVLDEIMVGAGSSTDRLAEVARREVQDLRAEVQGASSLYSNTQRMWLGSRSSQEVANATDGVLTFLGRWFQRIYLAQTSMASPGGCPADHYFAYSLRRLLGLPILKVSAIALMVGGALAATLSDTSVA